MSKINIIRIHHPSGKLFNAYRSFSKAHCEDSVFQLEDFIRLVQKQPETEWVLLLAVREEGLKDPGARPAPYRPGDIFKTGSRAVASSGVSNETTIEASKIAASLLALVTRETPPSSFWLKPLTGIWQKLTARTLVYGGPLLTDATRLQKELITKALLKALHQQVKKHSLFTLFRNSHDSVDMIPVFREMGYEYQPYHDVLHKVGTLGNADFLENRNVSWEKYGSFLRVNQLLWYPLARANDKARRFLKRKQAC